MDNLTTFILYVTSACDKFPILLHWLYIYVLSHQFNEHTACPYGDVNALGGQNLSLFIWLFVINLPLRSLLPLLQFVNQLTGVGSNTNPTKFLAVYFHKKEASTIWQLI